MSSNEEDTHYGYGKDLRLKIGTDGELDLVISPTGDLDIVGGDSEDTFQSRAENAAQQIKLRLITPFNTLKDENGQPISIGSQLHTLFGKKITELSAMLLKSYILASIIDLPFLDSVIGIDFVSEEKDVAKSTELKIMVRYKLKNDVNIYFSTIDFNESVV